METPERQLAGFVSQLQPRGRARRGSANPAPDGAWRSPGPALPAPARTASRRCASCCCEQAARRRRPAFVFGDRLPARAAAQLNATLCRALDYCDAMAPGPHIGAALFPAAMAVAELAGGCTGADFTAALAAGAELASRFNLSEAQYDGFDPTGIAVVFAAAGAASRIIGLDADQTLNALALAFNRCGGSFQSHVDGSLGVRIVQGWVAEAGVQCAQMARRGITGPANFLAGHYGYAHLYGRGTLDPGAVVAGLGREWKASQRRLQEVPELRRRRRA